MIGKFTFAALLPLCVFAADSMNIEDYFKLDPQAELVYMEINRNDPAVEKSALELYRPSVVDGVMAMCDFSAKNVADAREVSAFFNFDQYSLFAVVSEYKRALFVNRMFFKWRDGRPATGCWTINSDQPVDMKKFIERTPAGVGLAGLMRLNVGRFIQAAKTEVPAAQRLLAGSPKLEELLLNLPDNGEYYFNVIAVDKKLYAEFEFPADFSRLAAVLPAENRTTNTAGTIRFEDDSATIEVNAVDGGVRVNVCVGDGKADFALRTGAPNLSADREFNRMAKLAESDQMPNGIMYISPSFAMQMQALNPQEIPPAMASFYQVIERYSGGLSLGYSTPEGNRLIGVAGQDCALQMIELEVVVPPLIALGTILPAVND